MAYLTIICTNVLVWTVTHQSVSSFSTTRKNSRCLVEWSAHGQNSSIKSIASINVEDSTGKDSFPPAPALCKFNSAPYADLFPEVAPKQLTFGTFDVKTKICTPVGLSAQEKLTWITTCQNKTQKIYCNYKLVGTSTNCKVWWREVNQDVIPPIPELVIPLGAMSSNVEPKTPFLLALCRPFNSTTIGALVMQGPDYGKCIVILENGEVSSLDGGGFHLLQAVELDEKGVCF